MADATVGDKRKTCDVDDLTTFMQTPMRTAPAIQTTTDGELQHIYNGLFSLARGCSNVDSHGLALSWWKPSDEQGSYKKAGQEIFNFGAPMRALGMAVEQEDTDDIRVAVGEIQNVADKTIRAMNDIAKYEAAIKKMKIEVYAAQKEFKASCNGLRDLVTMETTDNVLVEEVKAIFGGVVMAIDTLAEETSAEMHESPLEDASVTTFALEYEKAHRDWMGDWLVIDTGHPSTRSDAIR